MEAESDHKVIEAKVKVETVSSNCSLNYLSLSLPFSSQITAIINAEYIRNTHTYTHTLGPTQLVSIVQTQTNKQCRARELGPALFFAFEPL